MFPKATGRPKDEVVLLTGRVARISLALTIPAAVIISILSPILLKSFYGARYLGATEVFRVLVIEVCISSTIWVLGQAFMALDRPGMVSMLQGVGVMLSFPLMLVLIPRFGLVGAGYALLGSTIARLFFILLNYPLSLKVPIPRIWLSMDDITWVRSRLGKA